MFVREYYLTFICKFSIKQITTFKKVFQSENVKCFFPIYLSVELTLYYLILLKISFNRNLNFKKAGTTFRNFLIFFNFNFKF